MPDDTEKTAAPGAEALPFTTAAEKHGILDRFEERVIAGFESVERGLFIGLTRADALEAVPESFAPATAGGSAIPHVRGPGQSAVDPIAAGLDVTTGIANRAENRVITQTYNLVDGETPAPLDKPAAPPASS